MPLHHANGKSTFVAVMGTEAAYMRAYVRDGVFVQGFLLGK